MFERVAFPEERAVELRALGERGSLVFVMRWPRVLSLSYFEYAYARRALPRPSVAWAPRGGRWTRIVKRVSAEELAAAVKEGKHGLIFLRGGSGRMPATEDPFVALGRVVREGRAVHARGQQRCRARDGFAPAQRWRVRSAVLHRALLGVCLCRGYCDLDAKG